MLKIVEKSDKVADGNRIVSEKALKAMKEGTLVISKLVVAVNDLKKTVEDFDRREERREEKRRELELKREEEWRKALGRLREEERDFEDRRDGSWSVERGRTEETGKTGG